MNKLRSYLVTGIILLFGLGALSRLLNDPNAPKLLRGALDAVASLFSKTING